MYSNDLRIAVNQHPRPLNLYADHYDLNTILETVSSKSKFKIETFEKASSASPDDNLGQMNKNICNLIAKF